MDPEMPTRERVPVRWELANQMFALRLGAPKAALHGGLSWRHFQQP